MNMKPSNTSRVITSHKSAMPSRRADSFTSKKVSTAISAIMKKPYQYQAMCRPYDWPFSWAK